MRLAGRELVALLDGAAEYDEGTAGGLVPHRLPSWARAQVDDVLLSYVEQCATGVRLRFDTAATQARLTVSTRTIAAPDAEPSAPTMVARRGGAEAVITLEHPTVVVVDERGVQSVRHAPPETVEVPLAGTGPVDIFLPHNARTEIIALETDDRVSPVSADGTRWTHYGSSISNGLNALHPTRTWPAQAATALGWHLRDLSFAGNAQLDPFAARLIASIPADIITLKVGINLVNADSMRERTFRPALHGFLDTIRENQPRTDVVVITAIACPIHESSPGPVVAGDGGMMRTATRSLDSDAGALTLARTRELVAEVVSARQTADAALTLIDGRTLFGESDVAHLYDGLHPDQDGLDLIARRFTDGVGALRS